MPDLSTMTSSTVQVQFVGPAGKSDRLMQSAGLGAQGWRPHHLLSVRPAAVRAALEVLKAVHPLYQDIVIDYDETTTAAMQELPHMLEANAEYLTDDVVRAVNEAAQDDTDHQARPTDADVELPDMEGDSGATTADVPGIMHHVLVTSVDPATVPESGGKAFLRAAKAAMFQDGSTCQPECEVSYTAPGHTCTKH
jgi:hypothetical protein